MDYITSWIREIIILILMAVVLELLLPNSGLQRYVRMVVGLLLLLALLQPVLSIFDTDLDEMFDHLSTSSVVSEEQMKNSMKSTKNEIQASNRAYIEKYMDVQLKKQIKKEVSERFHMGVASVNVTLDESKPDDSSASIQSIDIYLTEQMQKEEEGEEVVEPVEPVTIDPSEPQEEPSENDGKQKEIRDFLAERWQLPPDKVTVVMEGGDASDNE